MQTLFFPVSSSAPHQNHVVTPWTASPICNTQLRLIAVLQYNLPSQLLLRSSFRIGLALYVSFAIPILACSALLIQTEAAWVPVLSNTTPRYAFSI